MIAESKEKLPAIGHSRGKIVFRFDFREIQRERDDGQTETAWQFQQVMIPPPLDRARLIDAVISNRYDKSAEIALINNRELSDACAAEYETYQAYRAQAKKWANEAIPA